MPTPILLVLLLNHFLYQVTSSCDGPVVFSYPSFNTTSCNTSLLCMGAVVSGDGFLNMTAGPLENSSATAAEMADLNAIARVLYKEPIQAWPASFCTTFSIRIFPHLNETWSGDGMAFVMAQDNHSSPQLSFGSYLGLQDQKTAGKTKFQQLAIEFDTFKNELDPDDNHIAIDTRSVQNSLIAKSLNPYSIHLKSGKQIKIKITYNGWEKNLQIYVGYEGDPLVSFLNHSIKVSKTIPSHVYVGFTSSTGTLAETHQVLDWVFTSTPLPYSSVKDNKKTMTILATLIPILGVLTLIGLCSFPIVRRRMARKRERVRRMEDIERRSATTAPRKFSYKQLAKATKNFSKEKLLGTGGFGSVYKGTLADPPQTIAVKKISANSQQGEREYLAEICTIGRLRHKNILQLQGWCHENEHLLLVYEYMPNKSLHQFLINGGHFIDWKTRYKMLTGLASALLYLHEECGDPVVHRDVKPSNVMLDAEFNPRLGDFGLARLLNNMGGVTTMVAGTLGYMAPEVSYTGKATTESDVYSFGVVALEVVCGKRFNNLLGENCLVEYVWDMHIQNSLLECVDQKLSGDFDHDQAMRILSVALACLHLDSNLRPKMRKVVQVLMNPDEPFMDLPGTRPRGVYVSIYGFSNPPSMTNSILSSSVAHNFNDYPSTSGESLTR